MFGVLSLSLVIELVKYHKKELEIQKEGANWDERFK